MSILGQWVGRWLGGWNGAAVYKPRIKKNLGILNISTIINSNITAVFDKDLHLSTAIDV